MQTWMLYFTIITEFRICRKILDDQHMFVTTFFCTFVYVCQPKTNLMFKGNSPIMQSVFQHRHGLLDIFIIFILTTEMTGLI
jgi:hypothetical protein